MSSSTLDFPNTSRAAVIIKAAPDIGRKHGETVCVAGIDFEGQWHRLYPVPFRDLSEKQKFSRWDILEFEWRKAPDDDRAESKRINPQTLKVVGSVPPRERHSFARRALVEDLDKELDGGKSFALIRPTNVRFRIYQLPHSELQKELAAREALHKQTDMFSDPSISREPPPYRFNYRFDFAGKRRNYNCIDWETEATFFKWRAKHGEDKTLELMAEKFDKELPAKGVAFAMGTHRNANWRNWLLSGVLRVDREVKPTLF